MKIVVSGASGLIGRAVVRSLKQAGHDVRVLVRRPTTGQHEIFWNPARSQIDPAELEGTDAVIHLAGRPIACRWNAQIKEEIRASRVESTKLLAQTFAKLSRPPQALLCASAIGYYGNRGDELLTEGSAPGKGFLPETCQAWEAAAREAEKLGTRVVCLRFGHVLSVEGGALGKLLPIFRLGIGGPIGSGLAWWSWIARSDVVRAITFLLENESLSGPFNLTAPEPVRNRDFARTLGRVLGRPALFPVPTLVLEVLFGEMARAALLASSRVLPERLSEAGFRFALPNLETALRQIITTRE